MRTGTEGPSSDSAPTVAAPRVGPGAESPAPRGPFSGAPPAPPAGPGIGTKIFVAAALLVGVTVGLAVAFATWRANQVAEASIREALGEIPNVYASYRGNLDAQLRGTLHALADDAGTKALLDEGVSSATVWEWTHDKQPVLGARTVFLFDRAGVLRARSDRKPGEDEGRPFRSVRWVSDPIEGWKEVSANIREGKVLAAVAAVPIIAGDRERNEAHLQGVLAAAFTLDEGRARALKGITGGQTGFVANTARQGEPPKLEVSAATTDLKGEALLSALSADTASVDALFAQGREIGPLQLLVGADRRVVAGVPLKSATGETLGAFLVSRSRDEETASFRKIRDALLAIAGISILLAVPVSFAMGRRIARPLKQLAEGAVAIREGNLDVKLPEAGSDEVGALARAFSAMVGELKEKAALEEMIADMRRRSAEATKAAATAALTTPAEVGRVGGSPRPGTLFAGRYRIEAPLGRGGMGAVYRARDLELDDEIALKVLMPEAFEGSAQAVQTLKQEIRLARKITHPNVVRTHDLGESDGVRFLTMEYVPGTTLREVIDRRGAVALGPGLQIAKQLCRGLGAVHEAGIVHRDIKPHNIMVLPNGVVKLMDFGIARVAEAADAMSQSHTVGTPYYMSPEQAQGTHVDERSDIYAVGVVLYELFAGVRPIEAPTAMEVMRRHMSVEPERLTLLRPDLPDVLERIVMACLAKDPAKRPPSANDLHGALMRVAA